MVIATSNGKPDEPTVRLHADHGILPEHPMSNEQPRRCLPSFDGSVVSPRW